MISLKIKTIPLLLVVV